jgi:hypothetical protein
MCNQGLRRAKSGGLHSLGESAMRWKLIATWLTVLAWTGSALAQNQLPEPQLETLPTPTPYRTALGDVVTPPVVSGAVFPLEALPSAAGTVSLDVDAVLWLSPIHRSGGTSAVTAPVGTVPAINTADTFGDERLSRRANPGARVALGYWWTADDPWAPAGRIPLYGVETRFFFVGQRSATVSEDQSPTLTRPFYSLNDGSLSGVVVAAPGLATGALTVTASESLWGGEANYWSNLYYDWPGTTCSVEGMVGVRYLNLRDDIRIGRVSAFNAAPVGFPAYAFLAGNLISEQESFATRNQFLGGQVGVRGNMFFDKLVISGELKLAVGNVNEQITIQGSQTRTLPSGQVLVASRALLALPSNIGRHNRNQFAEVPEMGVKFAFPINNYLTIAAAFNTMYWSRIARPADQIDRVIDTSQIPSFPSAGAAPGLLGRPTVPFTQSDYWLFGAMLTAEFTW